MIDNILAYVAAGRCVLRHDNERGKGDHRHHGEMEEPSAKRWELVKALCGAGPVSIREAGVLDRIADGRIEFPYDAVKVEFMLQVA